MGFALKLWEFFIALPPFWFFGLLESLVYIVGYSTYFFFSSLIIVARSGLLLFSKSLLLVPVPGCLFTLLRLWYLFIWPDLEPNFLELLLLCFLWSLALLYSSSSAIIYSYFRFLLAWYFLHWYAIFIWLSVCNLSFITLKKSKLFCIAFIFLSCFLDYCTL